MRAGSDSLDIVYEFNGEPRAIGILVGRLHRLPHSKRSQSVESGDTYQQPVGKAGLFFLSATPVFKSPPKVAAGIALLFLRFLSLALSMVSGHASDRDAGSVGVLLPTAAILPFGVVCGRLIGESFAKPFGA